MDKLLVIHECDLPKSRTLKELGETSLIDSPFSIYASKEASVVIFVGNSGATKVLKNRYGDKGVVLNDGEYKHYLRLLQKERDENNKLNNPSKKKRFLGRIFRINIWPFYSS